MHIFNQTGETSCGKSSIINLILGEMILPTSITASTSRVCRIKHSEQCMVSTRNSKDEEIDRTSFENSMEMAKTLETLAQTNSDEISYVDIYMPVPLIQVGSLKTSHFLRFYNCKSNLKQYANYPIRYTVLTQNNSQHIQMFQENMKIELL